MRLSTIAIEFVCHYEQDLAMNACAKELQALIRSLNTIPPVHLVFTASQRLQDGRPGVAGMSVSLHNFISYTLEFTGYGGHVQFLTRDRV